MTAPGGAGSRDLPRICVSVSALLADDEGRLLIVKPTYKPGWSLPGGQMEADGESPWDACRREVHEECGLIIARGHLRCLDFLAPKADRPDDPRGLRIVFDCGVVPAEDRARIVVQAGEIAEHRFAVLDTAAELLSGPIRRRVLASFGASGVVYLEDGRRVDGVPE